MATFNYKMRKIRSTSAKLRQYVEDFSSTVFKTDGKTLFCNICDQAISSNKRFQVTQHLSTAKHLSNSTRKEKMKQIFIKDSFEDQNSEFSLDLCRAFLASADIPYGNYIIQLLIHFCKSISILVNIFRIIYNTKKMCIR